MAQIKEGSVVTFYHKGNIAIGTVSNIERDRAILHNTYSPKGGGQIRGAFGGIVKPLQEIKLAHS